VELLADATVLDLVAGDVCVTVEAPFCAPGVFYYPVFLCVPDQKHCVVEYSVVWFAFEEFAVVCLPRLVSLQVSTANTNTDWFF
jgi:hypothetical protein